MGYSSLLESICNITHFQIITGQIGHHCTLAYCLHRPIASVESLSGANIQIYISWNNCTWHALWKKEDFCMNQKITTRPNFDLKYQLLWDLRLRMCFSTFSKFEFGTFIKKQTLITWTMTSCFWRSTLWENILTFHQPTAYFTRQKDSWLNVG